MAASILKLIASKTPTTTLLMISIFFLFLVTNVKSDFSFQFPTFEPNVNVFTSLGLANDATLSNGLVQLTKKDKSGNPLIPLQNSVGQLQYTKPIRLYDKYSGKVASFTTEFSFVLNKKGRKDHGDGMAFFLISPDFEFPDPKKSDGGFLGMFTPDTAFNCKDKQVLLVEFDSFGNEWDPVPVSHSPHIGIDVSSIKSVVTAPLFNDFEPIVTCQPNIPLIS